MPVSLQVKDNCQSVIDHRPPGLGAIVVLGSCGGASTCPGCIVAGLANPLWHGSLLHVAILQRVSSSLSCNPFAPLSHSSFAFWVQKLRPRDVA